MQLSQPLKLNFKKYAFLLAFLPPSLLPGAVSLWQQHGYPDLFAWYPLVILFLILPLADHLIGKDTVNPNEDTEVPALSNQWYYRILTALVLPVQLITMIYAAYIFVDTDFGWAGYLGWLLSTGAISGVLAINVGHEMVHKDARWEQWIGGTLLACVCYGGFKVEHVRGHHVNVSTPKDASSARYGQSLYQFLPHAYWHNFLNAWKLEQQRLAKKQLPLLHWRNELIWWYGISAVLLLGFTLAWGWMGAVFFLLQSFYAFSLLEIINYVEHYGLHRRQPNSGKYERTTIEHSWNSNYTLTNLFLFHLARHSDHHANPRRRYQVLRHFDESPQLPTGYAGMVVLALIPALWFRVMNPRVEAYYKDEPELLSAA